MLIHTKAFLIARNEGIDLCSQRAKSCDVEFKGFTVGWQPAFKVDVHYLNALEAVEFVRQVRVRLCLVLSFGNSQAS